MKYFSHHAIDGFELHDTEEQAIAAATASLLEDKEDLDDELEDWVLDSCWGEVRQIVEKKSNGEYDFVDVPKE